MEADEQRYATRKPVVLKVRFRASTVEEFAERYSRDLSEGGMFVRSPGPLPQPGTVLLLECRLSDGALLINGGASVAWVRPQANEEGPSGFGMRFDDLSAESRAVLAMILETSQQAAAAKASGPALSRATVAAAPPAHRAPAAPVAPVGSGIGVTRFPTLIGELPPMPPVAAPTTPAPLSQAAPSPSRPAWFRSHEFDDDEAAAEPPSPAAPPPSASGKAVPAWFHSTALLEGTPAPVAEPRGTRAAAAPATTPAPASPPLAAAEPVAQTPSPRPEAPTDAPRPLPERRPTQPQATAPDRPPRLPRPTPAVVAAPPRDVAAEPSFPGLVPARKRRHWLAAVILSAAAFVAFGVGYVFLEFVLPDKSAEVLRELERHSTTGPAAPSAPSAPVVEPPPAVLPAPTPAPSAPSAALPEAERPPPATSTPSVVIPHAPARSAAPEPAPTRAPTARRRSTPKPVATEAEPKASEDPPPSPRKPRGGSNTDFQKRLRELERLLKRK